LTVYTIDTAGGSPKTIEIGAFPTWSANGHLAVNVPGYMLSIDGRVDSTILTNFTRAAWMPDGVHLILALCTLTPITCTSFSGFPDTSQGSLYLQSTTDTASRVLLLPGSLARYFGDPVVSPDGLHVAFTELTNQSSTQRIWVMGIDGKGAVALTAGPTDYEPSWSPDGKQIAFIRVNHVFVMNADGTNLAQVSSGAANDMSWGP
jgi:Tol biopolymer transport system component